MVIEWQGPSVPVRHMYLFLSHTFEKCPAEELKGGMINGARSSNVS